MNKFYKTFYFTALLCLTLITSLSLLNAKTKKLFILQTNDIHANTYSSKANLFKLSTLLKNTIKQCSKDKTILLDIGDTFQGSYEAALTKGEYPAFITGQMNYDLIVPGNHDFDFGIDQLQYFKNKYQNKLFAANLFDLNNTLIFQPFKIIKKNNFKTIIISLANDSERYLSLPATFKIKKYLTCLKELMPRINKEKPDLIILAIHHSHLHFRDKIAKISKIFPQIKIILGAHKHQIIAGKCCRNAFYCEAGSHANGLMKITVQFNPQNKAIHNITAQYLPVTNKTHIDQKLRNLAQKKFPKATAYNKDFAFIKGKIKSDDIDSNNSSAINLFGAAMANKAQTTAAIVDIPNKRKFLSNNINLFKLFLFYRFENALFSINLNFNEFQKLAKYCQNKKSHFKIWGIEYSTDKTGNINAPIKLTDNSIWQQQKQKKISFATSAYVIKNCLFKNIITQKKVDSIIKKSSSLRNTVADF